MDFINPEKVKIRSATLEDIQVLAALGAKTFIQTFAKDNTPEDMAQYISETFNKEKIQEEIHDKNNTFFIASIDDTALGYAKITRKAPDGQPAHSSLEIERLYVDAIAIGKGVGKFLMEKCIHKAQFENIKTIWLGVWEHNLRAIKFYKDFGFKIAGSQKFKLGSDVQNDFIMVKDL